MPRIGLDNLEIAVVTANTATTFTTSTRKKVFGAVSAKLTGGISDAESFYADDMVYDVASSTAAPLSLEFEVGDLGSDITNTLLGVKKENGMLKYDKSIVVPTIALSFRSKDSKGKYVYIGLCAGKFASPDLQAGTMADKTDFQTATIQGQFFARQIDGLNRVDGYEDDEDFQLENFYTAVYGTATQG